MGAPRSSSRPKPAAPTRSVSMPPPGSASRSSAIRSMEPGRGRCCSTPCRSASNAAPSLRSRRPPRFLPPSSMPVMAMSFELPEDALEERFLAASGPGGQNVNKVATACQLRCDVFRLGLAPDVYQRLKTLAGSRMTAAGEIVITARKYRTQEANREDARVRLAELVAKAHIRQAKRKKTRDRKRVV